MPLRRTERSDGRARPRWKDGSHRRVENPVAEESPSATRARSHRDTDRPVSTPVARGVRGYPTRGRRANAGADARIAESGADGEMRVAILPYGRRYKGAFRGPTNEVSNPRGDRGPRSPDGGDSKRGAPVRCRRRHHPSVLRAGGGRACRDAGAPAGSARGDRSIPPVAMRRPEGDPRSRARAQSPRAGPGPAVGHGREDPGNPRWRGRPRATRSRRGGEVDLHSAGSVSHTAAFQVEPGRAGSKSAACSS
jgi:hypothetical protein